MEVELTELVTDYGGRVGGGEGDVTELLVWEGRTVS